MAGRRPKPTAQKILEGNPGKRALNPNEPTAVAGLPRCPGHLSQEARREWNRLGKQLVAEKRMAIVYKSTFATYCMAWARWVEAEKHLKEEGLIVEAKNGYVQQSPWLSISNRAVQQMHRAATELGLSPSSQSRVSKVKQSATVSRFQAFMGGKREDVK